MNSSGKSSAADPRPFLSGTMISVVMAGTCLQSESYFTSKHNFTQRNPVDFYILMSFFTILVAIVSKEQNALRGEFFLYMYTLY